MYKDTQCRHKHTHTHTYIYIYIYIYTVIGGVGILLSPHALKSLNSIKKIQSQNCHSKDMSGPMQEYNTNSQNYTL